MVKRVFDVVVAGISLILFAPVMAIAGVLVKLDSPGPVIYAGPRVGRNAIVFKMYKLRTMANGADRQGSALTRGADPRVTRVGRVLRKYKIDELPQLVNVLRGEMSVVGPRPEAPAYVRHYTPEQRQVLTIRPGITGPTQVKFRHEETLLQHCTNLEEEYVNKIMPQKLSLDLEYVRRHSLFTDLKLIVQTGACLFARDQARSGATAEPA